MQSSTSLKAACLTAGLVTAWSPLTDQTAQADSIKLSVNLNSSAANNSGVTTFTNVYVAFSGSALASPAIMGPNDLSSASESTDWPGLPPPAPISSLSQFAAMGLDANNDIVVSVTADPDVGATWDEAFPGFNQNDIVAAFHGSGNSVLLANFINTVGQSVGSASDPGPSADLYSFGPDGAQGFGSLAAEADADNELPSPVPLPSAFIMGGALLGALTLANLAVVRLRRCQSLGIP